MQFESPLLYEDENWLAVNKPTGIATHAAHPGGSGIVEWLTQHLGHSHQICSRLDKGTSGILLLAKNSSASSKAQTIHEQQLAIKKYRLISHKRFVTADQDKAGEILWQRNDPLAQKDCTTKFRLLEENNGFYIYEAIITRGRTHQIRQHAAMSGIPIVGDTEYGGIAFQRLCLHCESIQWPEFNRPVEAPVPDSFSHLLSGKSKLLVDGAVSWERRLGWPLLVSNSFRIIHRKELEIEVTIDLYDSYLSITGFEETESSKTLQQKLSPLLQYLATKVEVQGGIIRRHMQNPHQKKLIYDVVEWGNPIPETLTAQEHGLLFSVHLNDSQHVGLFLDQRDNRRFVALNSQQKRVANLFAFTCSFSVAAVYGGAEIVFSIDLAGSALTRGKQNFARNMLDKGGRGKFIQEDVCKWLARQEKKKKQDPSGFRYWNLIICDPPVYASGGKGKSFHVEKQWPELARQIHTLLVPGGIALFANNHRSGNPAFYVGELQKHFSEVTPLTPPLDFPKLQGQPDHVRIYLCKV